MFWNAVAYVRRAIRLGWANWEVPRWGFGRRPCEIALEEAVVLYDLTEEQHRLLLYSIYTSATVIYPRVYGPVLQKTVRLDGERKE